MYILFRILGAAAQWAKWDSRKISVWIWGGLLLPVVCTLSSITAAEISFSEQPAGVSVSVGADVTFEATIPLVGGLEYRWLKDGVEMAAGSGRITAFRGGIILALKLGRVSPQDAGDYRVRVTDSATGAVGLSEAATLSVDLAFTKVTTGSIVTDEERSVGAAWGDFDDDGDIDLLADALYRNEGDATFTRIIAGDLGERSESSHGCAWADVDNDGWLDVYLSNITGQNFLFRNLGGEFISLGAEAGDATQDVTFSIGVAWGDFDRDGWVDLFTANGGIIRRELDRLYRNNRNGSFATVNKAPFATDSFISDQGVWSDYDNDGDPDLFVTHYGNERNSLYRNDGNGKFESVVDEPLTTERYSSFGAAWGDYNNDGFPDLFVTTRPSSGNNGRNSLYRNRGDGTFEKITKGSVATDSGIFIGCAWADYDNDGWLDLIVSAENQPRAFYQNNGDGSFTRLTGGSVVNDINMSVACAWADYDDNGFPDLFIANGPFAPAKNSLYRNNGNGNAWIKIRCVGTLSNRSAIGTKIRVKARVAGVERWQLREISGGSGYMGQDSFEQLVGVGDAAMIDTLRVEWPSGVVQEFHDLDVRQTVRLVEPIQLQHKVRVYGGNVELKLNGKTGRLLEVQACSALSNWETLEVVSPDNNILRFADREAEDATERFYRVRIP